MMDTDGSTGRSGDDAVQLLTDAECWHLLDGASFGRLAVSVGNQPEIFPVNFLADGHTVLFRTAEGTKLLELTINSLVAFESDYYSDTDAWSVVIKGRARAIESQSEIFAADQLPLAPWIPTLKYVYVRIQPTEVTGRRFARGPEPDRY
ncbi:pyridoxamine 5'-phosphate oxidase family protein [Lacisediminihabitans sp. H27-G8]|uniref:pyridoxamine 5'-phosphate oxidase family protein n=1 Tax=Lacisediminihabitans sp. H27-G8 TaxID=3111909 RepID=UPI0038FCE274